MVKWDKDFCGFVIWEQNGRGSADLCCFCLASPFQDFTGQWPLTVLGKRPPLRI